MGGEMGERMDADSLLGSRGMEPAPRCGHLQLERGVRRREAQPRHGGRPLGRGPVARDEHKPQRREIREMEAKREKVPCVCRQFLV